MKRIWNFLKSFSNSNQGLLALVIGVLMVVFIDTSFAVGYLLGTITGRSYSDVEQVKFDPYHVFGCILGILIGLGLKLLIRSV